MKLSTFVSAAILSASTAFAGNNFYGIAASNSLGGRGSYTCRSQEDWNWAARTAHDNGFKAIFVTGMDCDALHRASRAARDVDIKVLAGIYIKNVGADMQRINNEVQTFRSAYQEFGRDRYEGLLVGNEVNDSTGAIMAKVYDVRGYLNSVGVNVPVSTTHTWVRVRDEPALCGADFVAANAHAFYDGNRSAKQAGDFVMKTVIPELKRVCPGKPIIISESGWPSRGDRNREAIASGGDEREALLNLNCAARDDRGVKIFAFEVDDQSWKDNDRERSFGIFNKVGLNNDIFNVC